MRRFFAHVTAEPLRPTEQREVADHLDGELRRLFYAQSVGDQRHALAVLHQLGPEPSPPEAQAALLHDIGKHDVGLGGIGRSCATLWAWTGLPIWGSWRSYIEHGERGAQLLDATSADPFVVAFTRAHPGNPPPGVDRASWRRVAQADDAA